LIESNRLAIVNCAGKLDSLGGGNDVLSKDALPKEKLRFQVLTAIASLRDRGIDVPFK
jgi:hypothetical protein